MNLQWLALIIGALLYPCAITPFPYFWGMEFSLALLLSTWQKTTPKKAFFRGWLYGSIAFILGIHWLFYSLHDYGGLTIKLSISIIIIVSSILGLTHGLHGWFLTRFFPQKNKIYFLLAFPLILSILSFFPGVPFSFIGITHINTPLRGIVPYLGEPGLIFFIAQSGAILYLLFQKAYSRKYRFLLIIYLVVVWTICAFLDKKEVPSEKQLTVSALQTNLTPNQKWNPALLQEQFCYYLEGSLFSPKDTQLIIWPEITLPYISTELILFLQNQIKSLKIPILLGILREEKENYFNSALLITDQFHTYDKRKLMLFGEFVPSWLNYFKTLFPLPANNFTPGQLQQPLLKIGDDTFAINICYETLFARLTWINLPQAKFIVAISDDSWFKNSWVLYQHLATAQMLSLSSGRYQVFVNNGGINAFIDDHGNLIKIDSKNLPLTATIKLRKDLTFWIAYRYHIMATMLGLLISSIIWQKKGIC